MRQAAADFSLAFLLAGEDAMTGDTDKYLGPQDLKELGDDSLPAEGYMGFSLGARSARYCICCFLVFVCHHSDEFLPTKHSLSHKAGVYFETKQTGCISVL